MQYLTIDTRTDEGKVILELIRKNKSVKLLNNPNQETRNALKEGKDKSKRKPMPDTKGWLESLS